MECLRWRGPTGWVYLDSADLNFSNRPVRTRMPGGVAGARPDGRPLCRFVKQPQKEPKRPCPGVRPSLRSGVPRSGPAPWARRDGPSLAQHGSPGIHAGRPTAQNLLSASRRGGQIKSTARRGGRPAGLVGGLHSRPVVADEPCEAALGLVRHCDIAVVKSASSVNQAYGVHWFCDRCALERSLVLLVNCYVEG